MVVLMIGLLISTIITGQPGPEMLRWVDVIVIIMMSLGVLCRMAAIIGLITLGIQQNLGG
jgi:hypothetical protein